MAPCRCACRASHGDGSVVGTNFLFLFFFFDYEYDTLANTHLLFVYCTSQGAAPMDPDGPSSGPQGSWRRDDV